MSEELEPCPFCGGSWFFQNKHSIGRRSIEGFFECEKCGARVGEGMAVFDGEDAQEKAAKLVNTRYERTCHVIIEDECPVCSGCGEDIDPSWVACPYCGAKVVG